MEEYRDHPTQPARLAPMTPISLVQRLHAVCIAVLLLAGCAAPSHYTSLDLELLPCEQGGPATPRFFLPVEFDAVGEPVYGDQVTDLLKRFGPEGRSVSDLVVFIHGWNKNPVSAENDYQNFICRLHGRLRVPFIPIQKLEGRLVVVGIFWPSTITNQATEPYLLKPVSYYRIRDRADRIASVGLANLFTRIADTLSKEQSSSTPEMSKPRVHLIGHSFGGRMVVEALSELNSDKKLVPLLMVAQSTSVVLINAATPAQRLDWLRKAASDAREKGDAGRASESTKSYFYNIHSFNDTANRVLFPLASALSNDKPANDRAANDKPACAAGACGILDYATLCVDASGHIPAESKALTDEELKARLNAWNVDASAIVFDHSDIYKGRMATLIADLLYNDRARQRYPFPLSQKPPTEGRCVSVPAS